MLSGLQGNLGHFIPMTSRQLDASLTRVALKKKYVCHKKFHRDKISIAGRNLDKGYRGGSAQGCLLPKDGREWMSGTSSKPEVAVASNQELFSQTKPLVDSETALSSLVGFPKKMEIFQDFCQ